MIKVALRRGTIHRSMEASSWNDGLDEPRPPPAAAEIDDSRYEASVSRHSTWMSCPGREQIHFMSRPYLGGEHVTTQPFRRSSSF